MRSGKWLTFEARKDFTSRRKRDFNCEEHEARQRLRNGKLANSRQIIEGEGSAKQNCLILEPGTFHHPKCLHDRRLI